MSELELNLEPQSAAVLREVVRTPPVPPARGNCSNLEPSEKHYTPTVEELLAEIRDQLRLLIAISSPGPKL